MFWRTGVIITVLASASIVHADQDAVKEARRLFVQGKQLYDKGRYFRSLKHFTAAMKYAPRPVILLNIAQCYRKLRLPPKALFYYDWYLSASRQEKPDRTPRFLAEVTEHITQRKKLITLYKQGEQQYRQKKYKAAMSSFRAARKILPWTRIHINIAQCHVKLEQRHLARARAEMAVKRYRRFLAAWRRAVPGESIPDHAEVQVKIRLLKQLLRSLDQALMARLTLTGLPGGAKIFVGGALQGTAPGAATLELPAGKHRVRVEQDGHRPWSRSFTLARGARVAERVMLQPVPPVPAVRPEPPGPPGRSKLLFASGIATGALAAGAEILALIYLAQANDLYLDDPRFGDYQNYVIAGHVTAGCMAAASAVLYYLYYRSGSEKPAPRSATFHLAPSRGGGLVGGRISF